LHTSPLHKAPGILACIPFAAGILLHQHIHLDYAHLQIITGIVCASLIVFQGIKISGRSHLNSLLLLLYLLMFLLLGLLRFFQVDKHNTFEGPIYGHFVATVRSAPIAKNKSYRVDLRLDSVILKQTSQALNTNIIAYLEKTEEAQRLLPGKRIEITSSLQAPMEAMNPGDFDYKSYLQRQEIFATCYLSQEDWKNIEGESYTIRIAAARIQNYVVNLLEAQNYGPKELALVAALTVGYKQMIDQDQRAAYVSSGATHVLAVSGLHVGIIYVFLMRIFKTLGTNKKLIILRTFFIIILLWCFAFITGLSPSVTRATLMFSLVALGKMSKQNSSIYNTVFMSAFLLLFHNPRLIYDLGFQLSYSAVLGIVSLQPYFSALFQQKMHLPKNLAELMAVSMAAQIGTAPISIHTFHCFPTYFLLTNIWIIPLVTIIVNGAVFLILLSLSPLPTWPIAKPLEWALKGMNGGVEIISHLPHALHSNLYIDQWTMGLIYASLIFFILALNYHSKYYLRGTLILIMLSLIYNFYKIESGKDQMQLYAFNDRKTFNICARQGMRSDIIIEEDKSLTPPNHFIQHFLARRTMKGSTFGTNYHNNNLQIYKDFILSPSALYAIYSPQLEASSGKIKVEALFINKEEPQSIYRLHERLKFKTLILYQRPQKHINYYLNFCEKNKIKLHRIYEDGAYVAAL